MRIRSYRVLLSLWNLGVLAVSLIAFGLVLGYANVSLLEREIERELVTRTNNALRLHSNRPGPLGPPGFRPGPPPAMLDLRRPRFVPLTPPPHNARGRVDEPLDPEAVAQRKRMFTDVLLDGERYRVLTIPVVEDERVTGVIQAARELRDVDLLRATTTRTLLIFLPLALLVAGAGAFFLANRALRPIAHLTSAAAQITAHDLSRRLNVEGNDEFAELAQTFDEMVARLDNAFKQLESTLDQQRRFTADASHELRTPLTRLRLVTSRALAESQSEEELRAALRTADAAAVAMAKLVDQLLVLARADAGGLSAQNCLLDLRVVAAEAVPPHLNARIQVDLGDEPVNVLGDQDHLSRLVANLLENALRHTKVGAITIGVNSTGEEATLFVSDEGEGIAAEHLPKIFDRFYRADAARHHAGGGTGLGLAICKSIAEAHGGRMEVESTLGVGTSVKLFLPLAKPHNFLITTA
jgi:two-component system, OmpR family, sensor kinase